MRQLHMNSAQAVIAVLALTVAAASACGFDGAKRYGNVWNHPDDVVLANETRKYNAPGDGFCGGTQLSLYFRVEECSAVRGGRLDLTASAAFDDACDSMGWSSAMKRWAFVSSIRHLTCAPPANVPTNPPGTPPPTPPPPGTCPPHLANDDTYMQFIEDQHCELFEQLEVPPASCEDPICHSTCVLAMLQYTSNDYYSCRKAACAINGTQLEERLSHCRGCPAPTVACPTVPPTDAPTPGQDTTEAPSPTPPPATLPPPTQTPDTPVPATPVPDTPVPATPVPATPVPATPVPATPVPATPVPATPVPATPTPGTPVPATPTPVTPTPATPVPATPVPATPVPATPVPSTPVPPTPVPATPVPPTPVPATPAPTPAPTPKPPTPAPTPAPTPKPPTPKPQMPKPPTPAPTKCNPKKQWWWCSWGDNEDKGHDWGWGFAHENPVPGSITPYGWKSGYSGCDIEVVVTIDHINLGLVSAVKLLNGAYRFPNLLMHSYEGYCGQHFSFLGSGVFTPLNVTGSVTVNGTEYDLSGLSAASGPSSFFMMLLVAGATSAMVLLFA